ncbi:MAG: hypothetical protein ACRDLK_14260, partial [Gaiellaceae bacterium]
RSGGGVSGMREWALLVGGRLEIRNGSPHGVQVSLRVAAVDAAPEVEPDLGPVAAPPPRKPIGQAEAAL